MAANTDPIFSKVGRVSSVTMTAACTKSDGASTIGTDIFKAFEADATNGSYVQKLRFIATASSAATTTNATTFRVYISTQTSGTTTSSDNWLWAEVSVPAVAADHSTNATNYYEIPLGFALPSSYTILVSHHASVVSNTAWRATVIGGNY